MSILDIIVGHHASDDTSTHNPIESDNPKFFIFCGHAEDVTIERIAAMNYIAEMGDRIVIALMPPVESNVPLLMNKMIEEMILTDFPVNVELYDDVIDYYLKSDNSIIITPTMWDNSTSQYNTCFKYKPPDNINNLIRQSSHIPYYN